VNPPKPTALKLLEGTVRKDRANPAEPRPTVGAVPPPFLPSRGAARVAWNRLAPMLERLRVLTEADADALALGCLALSEYLAARRDKQSWRRGDAAWKRYMATLTAFGLTPSARVRVHVAEADVADPLAEWMEQAK
jgi:Phage terminase, small subunit